MGNIGNEIYFKKEENEIEDNKMPFSPSHEHNTEVTHAGLDENNEAENNILETENNNWKMHGTATPAMDKQTTTHVTSITSPINSEPSNTYKTANGRENLLNENETIRDDIQTLDEDISNEILQRNESSQSQPPSFIEKMNKGNLILDKEPTEYDQRVIPTPTIPSIPLKPATLPAIYHKKIYKENSVIKSNDIVDDWDDDEADYSYEDFAVEHNGRTVIRQNKIRNHTSYQTSVFKSPLMQGFLATTGYPKFYIGESNCSWRISAPIGQRVRLTVLDINLRCKRTLSSPKIPFNNLMSFQTTSYAKILFKYLTWKSVECFSTAAANTLDRSKC